MPKSNTTNKYEKWMWIELIGFDNLLEDFNVQAFLDNADFKPDVISFLIFNPDFVHSHNPSDLDSVFPKDFCAYAGHPRNEERGVQPWTQRQLKCLITELHKHDIKVYLSFFDMATGDGWASKHTQLHYVLTDGHNISPEGLKVGVICPWKRLDDKNYYEDFFVEQLKRTITDYGFDGFHCADGYNQPRFSIFSGDASDDMIDQFTKTTGVQLPEEFSGKCDDNDELIAQRANWIYNNKTLEYVNFCTDRHCQFVKKVVDAMAQLSKPVVLNSAWTRDPFEAILRYGTDYKKLADVGVEGFVIEAASIALETLEQSKEPLRFLCDFMASNLLNKAYLPNVPLRWLHGIKDTEENWNALRQAPTALGAEIQCMSNLYNRDSEGKLARCFSGLMACLSDGIENSDWKRLKDSWDLGFAFQPKDIIGATLIWSDNAIDKQLNDYVKTRRWHVQQILRHLIALGARINDTARFEDIQKVHGPVICINTHLWAQCERDMIEKYSNGPVIVIGEKSSMKSNPDFMLSDSDNPLSLACGIYGKKLDLECGVISCSRKSEHDVGEMIIPPVWLDDLHFTDVSQEFLSRCVEVINKVVGGPEIIRVGSGHTNKNIDNLKTVALTCFVIDENKLRLLLRNDNYICLAVKIDIGQPIKNVQWLNRFTAATINPQNSIFNVKVPGRGVAVVEVQLDV